VDQYFVVVQLLWVWLIVIILAINSLNIANIVLDPTYIKPVEPQRLAVRNTKRGRPKNLGKALERD
jgi:hypothetical protein